MTPTEKARRSDALHQGPDTRRVLCDMIANRESDLEDARAENASLKNEVEMLKAIWTQVRLEGQSYKAENAKLRELLRTVVNKYCDSGTCDGCPILGKDDSCPY